MPNYMYIFMCHLYFIYLTLWNRICAENWNKMTKNKILIKSTRCTTFSNLFFGIKLYMFRTVPLTIIRSFSLYTQQWYMSYRHTGYSYSLRAGSGRIRHDPARKLSAKLYDIYHCCVYSEKVLIMDRGTVRNM